MNRHAWLWLLWGALVLYIAVPWFPLTPVEGDDALICAGIAQRIDPRGEPFVDIAYRYDAQVLAYWLPIWLARLTGCSAMDALGVLTIASFIASLVGGMFLLQRMTGVSLPVAGLTLFLFQEFYVASYWGNSTELAAGILMLACLAATFESWLGAIVAGVLFGTACLARFDAVVMAPALLVLLGLPRPGAAQRTLVFALVAALCFWLLAEATDFSFAAMNAQRKTHHHLYTQYLQTLKHYFTFYSGAVVFLAAVGTWHLVRQRDYRRLILAACGVLPLSLAYGFTVVTPKYLLYGCPFVALLVIAGGQWLAQAPATHAKRALLGTAAALFVGQYLLRPLPLIGYDGRISTDDHLRRLDGLVQTPWMWRTIKRDSQETNLVLERALRGYLVRNQQGFVVTDYWYYGEVLRWQLIEAGYKFQGMRDSARRDLPRWFVYRRGDAQILVYETNPQSFPPPQRTGDYPPLSNVQAGLLVADATESSHTLFGCRFDVQMDEAGPPAYNFRVPPEMQRE